MVSTDCWPSIVFPVLHELLEVGQHEEFDVWGFSGHDCYVTIHKSHAGEQVADGQLG